MHAGAADTNTRRLACTAKGVVVLDTTIIADSCITTIAAVFSQKVDYYHKKDIRTWIGGQWNANPTAIRFGAVVLMWRGALPGRSVAGGTWHVQAGQKATRDQNA